MGKIKRWHKVNFITKKPPIGCQLCSQGAKVVVFVTGECPSNCYYCPISNYRKKDIIFADEQKIERITDIIYEAKMIDAKGAGITGGEPAIHLPRVITIIKLLKEEFGSNFHCHLYTSFPLKQHDLIELFHAGLDEIRYHPPLLKLTDAIRESINIAKEFSWSVGMEVPVIPNKTSQLKEIVNFALTTKLDFVNFNEFEFTEANFKALTNLGFKPKNDISAAVEGSEELALRILKEYQSSPIALHYCSSRYKDRVQLKNRLIRRAKNYAYDFDIITDEGLIRRAIIRTENKQSLDELITILKDKFNIKTDLFEVKYNELTILTAEYIARKIVGKFKECYENIVTSIEIVEQYPFDKGIITYLEPLL